MICDERKCYICGQTGVLHTHHVHHGSRRKKADQYGLTVFLCPHCHQLLHDKGVYDKELQQIGQRYFEEQYGHEKWMEIFGKNYL